MTSRRLATVKGITLLAVAAATPDTWVTAISLYWAARTLGPVIEHHYLGTNPPDPAHEPGSQKGQP